MLTKELFLLGMGKLQAGFEKKGLDPDVVEVYWERVQGMDPQEWELAVNVCLDSHKFFPKISELLEAAQVDRPTPEEIWGKLLVAAEDGGEEPPEWVDEPTKKALLALGGWENFTYTNYDDLRFLAKTFKEIYQVARKQEQALRVEGPEPQRSIT